MTKNTKSSQGPTRACGMVVDLKRIVKNIEGLHSCAWSQQQKARHGATNQTVVEKANAARAAAAVGVEAPIEMADAATLKQDAEAAAAARAAAAVRAAAAEKMRKQVAAKAAQAKGGGDAAGPSSPAA